MTELRHVKFFILSFLFNRSYSRTIRHLLPNKNIFCTVSIQNAIKKVHNKNTHEGLTIHYKIYVILPLILTTFDYCV